METVSCDVLVIGGGAAGLRAAIEATRTANLSVAVLSKVYPMRSHTVSAEGGVAAVLKEGDTEALHAWDTVKGSDFLADQNAVEFFVRRASREVVQLDHWGCPWSRGPDGRLAVRAFGGMSTRRTAFAADKTGFHLLHTLYQTCLKYDNIVWYDEWFVTSLLVEEGRIRGVTAINLLTGNMAVVACKAAVLATGGAGRIYEFTSNGNVNTGDGMALACRAGAPLKDMEFVQYHPTLLPGSGILMTEAARGEGGYLVNREGERFLKRYLPEKMELGPRDMISRAIMRELREGKGVEGEYGQHVFLDVTHLGSEVLDTRLSLLKELAMKHGGIDPAKELIPVRPGVHYFMGGVSTNMAGETSIPGLFAAGEVACVSINGANRLGSNSLPECLVFGAQAGLQAARFAVDPVEASDPSISGLAGSEESRVFGMLKREEGSERVSELQGELQKTMESNVGIFREETGLLDACRKIRELKTRLGRASIEGKGRVYNTELLGALQLSFMLDVAEAVCYSALNRRESRGAHYRVDYPSRNDGLYLYHTLVLRGTEEPIVEQAPVSVTKWRPEERRY